MGKIFLVPVILLAAVAFGDSREERKLVDRLVKAQRRIERANAASEKAGQALSAYCGSEGKVVQVKPNGLIGCVPKPAPPPPAPAKP